MVHQFVQPARATLTHLAMTPGGMIRDRMSLTRFRALLALVPLLAGAPAFAERPASVKSAQLLDLDRRPADPFRDSAAKLLVFIFVQTDCPVTNASAPEIIRVHRQFATRGVTFWLVYPDANESASAIRRHLREFAYPCDALRDPKHLFAKMSRVRVTPEAAIYQPDGTLLYHGRIDNRYVELGKARPEATRHDLALALAQALAGHAVTPAPEAAIGCFIEDLK